QYRLTIHEMSTPEYVDAFIQGYKMSYQLGYADEYRTRANDDYSGMMEFFIISPAGTEIASVGEEISMVFQPGTFYRDANITIENKLFSNYNTREFNAASDVYELTLANPGGSRDLTKYVKISMPYYNTKYKAGIYKLVDGRWQY